MKVAKSRREEYSEATRQALLQAATDCFAEGGYAGTSLDDISAAARLTKGALYHHFEGKRGLFEAVMEHLESAAIQEAAAAVGEAPDLWEGAMAGLDAFLERCRDPVYGRIVIEEGPVALGFARWLECEQRYAYGLIQSTVRAGMEAGIFEPLPVEATTRVTFGMMSAAALAISEAPEDDRSRVSDEMRTVLRRFMAGLRAPD